MRHRQGEQGDIPERHERLFSKNNYWYFSTREGLKIGPFDTQMEANNGVHQFIEYISHVDPTVITRIKHHVKAA